MAASNIKGVRMSDDLLNAARVALGLTSAATISTVVRAALAHTAGIPAPVMRPGSGRPQAREGAT